MLRILEKFQKKSRVATTNAALSLKSISCNYMIPWSSIALATFKKPAMFAPLT